MRPGRGTPPSRPTPRRGRSSTRWSQQELRHAQEERELLLVELVEREDLLPRLRVVWEDAPEAARGSSAPRCRPRAPSRLLARLRDGALLAGLGALLRGDVAVVDRALGARAALEDLLRRAAPAPRPWPAPRRPSRRSRPARAPRASRSSISARIAGRVGRLAEVELEAARDLERGGVRRRRPRGGGPRPRPAPPRPSPPSATSASKSFSLSAPSASAFSYSARASAKRPRSRRARRARGASRRRRRA